MKIILENSQNEPHQSSEFIQTLLGTGIPLPYFIPKTRKNHYFYKNGLSHIIPRIKVKVHTNLEVCHELWEVFSPNKTIYDLWEYRMAFYDYYRFDLFFYTLYEGDVPMAVLPLWFNDNNKKYEIIGGEWMEDNSFFMKDPHFLNLLLKIFPDPIDAQALNLDLSAIEPGMIRHISPDDPKNIKLLADYKSMDDYLSSLTKKRRYNLRADYKNTLNYDPKIIVTSSNLKESMAKLVKLNENRFNGFDKEQSIFVHELPAEIYDNLLTGEHNFTSKFVEVYARGQLAGIDLIFQYRNIYYTDIGGNNVDFISGIGNFLVYYELQDAIENGFELIDCFRDDCGWKHRYFDQVPTYKIQIPPVKKK